MSESTRRDAVAFAALAILCVVAWRGISGHYFWGDDFDSIYYGKNLLSGTLFTSDPNFRPIDRIDFFLNFRLSGLDPRLYYLFNTALHLGNACLIYLLGRRLMGGRPAGFAVAAFFLTANMHSDAVFWISARPGLVSLFFLLASLNFWVQFRKTGKPAPWYYLTLVSLAFALLSKEDAVVYPFLIALTDLLLIGESESGKKRWAWYAGLLAVVAAYAMIQAYMQLGALSRSVYIRDEKYGIGLNGPGNVLELFLFLFTPSVLDLQSLSREACLALSVLVIAALLVAGYATGYRKQALWAVCWIAVAFLPMSFFKWELVTIVKNALIRRYFYTPAVAVSFVFGFFLVWLYNVIRAKKMAAAAVAAVFVAAIGWNIKELHGREREWDYMSGVAKTYLQAFKHLRPSVSAPNAGVYLGDFGQRETMRETMLRVVYDNNGIVLYRDDKELMSSDSVADKVFFYKKGDAVMVFPSGKAVRIKE